MQQSIHHLPVVTFDTLALGHHPTSQAFLTLPLDEFTHLKQTAQRMAAVRYLLQVEHDNEILPALSRLVRGDTDATT
jgi:hypothetical protein